MCHYIDHICLTDTFEHLITANLKGGRFPLFSPPPPPPPPIKSCMYFITGMIAELAEPRIGTNVPRPFPSHRVGLGMRLTKDCTFDNFALLCPSIDIPIVAGAHEGQLVAPGSHNIQFVKENFQYYWIGYTWELPDKFAVNG